MKCPWCECHRTSTDDKSTLVQVMAWCHQAPSHYLNQCWPRSMTPYCIITQGQSVQQSVNHHCGCHNHQYDDACMHQYTGLINSLHNGSVSVQHQSTIYTKASLSLTPISIHHSLKIHLFNSSTHFPPWCPFLSCPGPHWVNPVSIY